MNSKYKDMQRVIRDGISSLNDLNYFVYQEKMHKMFKKKKEVKREGHRT